MGEGGIQHFVRACHDTHESRAEVVADRESLPVITTPYTQLRLDLGQPLHSFLVQPLLPSTARWRSLVSESGTMLSAFSPHGISHDVSVCP